MFTGEHALLGGQGNRPNPSCGAPQQHFAATHKPTGAQGAFFLEKGIHASCALQTVRLPLSHQCYQLKISTTQFASVHIFFILLLVSIPTGSITVLGV